MVKLWESTTKLMRYTEVLRLTPGLRHLEWDNQEIEVITKAFYQMSKFLSYFCPPAGKSFSSPTVRKTISFHPVYDIGLFVRASSGASGLITSREVTGS